MFAAFDLARKLDAEEMERALSAELHRINHLIRERKKFLRGEVKRLAGWEKKTRKYILRNAGNVDRLTDKFYRETKRALIEARARLKELQAL